MQDVIDARLYFEDKSNFDESGKAVDWVKKAIYTQSTEGGEIFKDKRVSMLREIKEN